MKLVRDLLCLGIPELDEDGFKPRGRQTGMRLYGKGGSSAPAPDPNVGQAAMENVKLGREWLGFAKEQSDVANERQVKTDALTEKVTNAQLDTQDQANKWAQEDRQRTKDTFQPLEDQYIQKASDYASSAKQEEAAAQAKADVMASSATANQSNARQMAAMGVSPDSGRFAGVQRETNLNTALASAGAQNNAREVIRDKGLALGADAINVGKGLPSSTAAAYGIGTNAGNSAAGVNASANGQFLAKQGIMNAGYQGAMNGNSSAATILNNQYGNRLSAWQTSEDINARNNAATGQGVGTAVGLIATYAL